MIKKYLPWLIGLLYFACPYDLVPDFVLGPGWLDDLVVLGLVVWWVLRLKRVYQGGHRSSAHTRKKENGSGVEEPSEEDPHRILGLEPGASAEEINVAYKKLAARYHPDKVQHLGGEFQELAHKKFVAIQNAYDRLMK